MAGMMDVLVAFFLCLRRSYHGIGMRVEFRKRGFAKMNRGYETLWLWATSALSIASAITAACLIDADEMTDYLLYLALPGAFVTSLASLGSRLLWIRRRTQRLQNVSDWSSTILLVWGVLDFFDSGSTRLEVSVGGVFLFFGLYLVMLDEVISSARKAFIVTEH